MNDNSTIFGLMISLGKKEYTIEDLKYLTEPFHITETNLRTALSRLKRRKQLHIRKDGKKAYYSLSDKSVRISKNVALSFRNPNWKSWNNEWFGAMFSVPEQEKKNRHKIRKKLSAYRLAPLYPGFWIRPLNKSENLTENLINLQKNKYCTFFKLNFITYLDKKRVIKLWELNKTNKELNKGLDYLCKEEIKLKNITPEQALVKKITAGSIIVPLLFNDPLLPECYLPDNWKGGELRKSFLSYDKNATEISKKYWENIF